MTNILILPNHPVLGLLELESKLLGPDNKSSRLQIILLPPRAQDANDGAMHMFPPVRESRLIVRLSLMKSTRELAHLAGKEIFRFEYALPAEPNTDELLEGIIQGLDGIAITLIGSAGLWVQELISNNIVRLASEFDELANLFDRTY